MNDLEAYVPPQDQAQLDALEAEQRKLASSVGVIDDVLKWFEAMIAFYGDNDCLDITERTPEEEVKFALLMAKRQRADFRDKYQQFQATYSQFIQEKTD